MPSSLHTQEYPVANVQPFQGFNRRESWMTLTPSLLFQVTLAVMIFVSADALFPLLVSGGTEMDIDTAATSRVRAVSWLVVYMMSALCFTVSWRAVLAATRENLLFLSLIVFAILSALWSDSPGRSAYSAAQLGVITLFALAVPQRLSIEQALRTASICYTVMIGLSVAMIAVKPDLGISSSNMYSGAWRGIFIHKNHFGTQLSFGFAAFFCSFLLFPGRTRWLNAGLMLVTLALCFKSRSSTAVICCAAIPAVYAVLWLSHRSRSMLLGVVGLLLAGGTVGVSILTVGWAAIMEMIGKDPDISGRGELWEMIFDSIASRPVLGFGYDAFWSSSARDGGERITHSLVWSPGGAHNSWIELATQLGIVGLALWAMIFLYTVFMALRCAFDRQLKGSATATWPVLALFVIICWSAVESNLMRHGNSVHVVFALMTGYLAHFAASRLSATAPENAGRPLR